MALYLSEQQVTGLLTMPEAIAALEDAFRRQGEGEGINQSRRRLHLPNGTYHTMVAGDMGLEMFGIKTYASFRPQTRFLMLLYSAQNGDLLAMIEADKMGQMRTGAASGVATKYLARNSDNVALKVGIYGTGWQARSQLEAVCAVRRVERIVAYGRDEERRHRFCDEMQTALGVDVVSADAPEEASREQDVVITATSSQVPVLFGEWLSPGVHVNVVGSNLLMKREIDAETVALSDLIVVDSIEQSKAESGDLLVPYERRLFHWEQTVELADIVAGHKPGRTAADQRTLFKSNGIALEDVAVAAVAYRKAIETGIGSDIPLWRGV